MSKLFIILIFLTLFFFTSKQILAEGASISIKMVANNCNGCHIINLSDNNFIPSLKNLSKNEFNEKMNAYKLVNDNSIMSRINKVLSKEDIINLSEFYYPK